jgi:TetR/AcrR family acrAB operon transcriptional repressor
MVRKTKEDAEITRQLIIDAARETFFVRGVSRTPMETIAEKAGVTRGAIYWHFRNKTDLFQAMREQVFLPLIDRMDGILLVESEDDPLSCIERFFSSTIQVLNDDLKTRRTYEVMMTRCEYVDEFAEVLRLILSNCSGFIEKIELVYKRAQDKSQLRPGDDPAALAMDSHFFFTGLLHMWVKDVEDGNIRKNAIQAIKAHIALRRR